MVRCKRFLLEKYWIKIIFGFSDKNQKGFIEFTEFIIHICQLNNGEKADLLLFSIDYL